MIRGLGIDLCPVSRMAGVLQRHGGRFEARVFTEGERDYCCRHSAPAQHFAVRFAAKEAAIKALGGVPGIRWHDMEVAHDNGVPRLRFTGRTAAMAADLGVERTHLSLTHDADMAVAVVILEG